MNTFFKHRISRAIWTSAMGDAIGHPFEFHTDIDQNQVKCLITDTTPIFITDDTQMTLFALDALDGLNIDLISAAYVDWYYTQVTPSSLAQVYASDKEYLLSQEKMYVQRAPGITCLTACRSIMDDSVVDNYSKGCGAVMRLLPFVSLFETHDREEVIEFAIQTGHITHKHPEIKYAVRLFMELAYAMMLDGDTSMWSKGLWEHVLEIGTRKSIEDCGTGWTALECVDMAIWALYDSSSLEDILVKSISHSGDSDSVAAVACGLYGLSNKFKQTDTATFSRLKSRIVEKEIIQHVLDTM